MYGLTMPQSSTGNRFGFPIIWHTSCNRSRMPSNCVLPESSERPTVRDQEMGEVMEKNNIWVTPHGEYWAVKREGSLRAIRRFDTQSEATDWGRQRAKADKVELFVEGRDGKVRERDSYGRDPHPPKG